MHNDFKSKFHDLVAESRNILIVAHKGPDHDAIGSVLAMYSYLKAKYPQKKFHAGFESQSNPGLSYIPGYDDLEWFDNSAQFIDDKNIELYIVLDACEYRMVSNFADEFPKGLKTICIDHHVTEADKFTLTHIAQTASSTTQILADLLLDDEDIDETIAYLLVTGIMADTGALTFIRKDKATVLSTLERLIVLGDINIEEIKRPMSTIPFEALPLLKEFINNTSNVNFENNTPSLTYTYIDEAFVESQPNQATLKRRDYHFMILRNISDHPWGFVVKYKQDDPQNFSVSFRSTIGAPNVRLIAEKHFGGGGHDLSAGGLYAVPEGTKMSAKEICEKIVAIIRDENLVMTE